MKNVFVLAVLFSMNCFSQEVEKEFLETFFGNQYTISQREKGFEMIKESYITVDDFQQYQQYVRDSFALERLFFNREEDIEALNYLDISRREKKTVEQSDRQKLRNEFHLNRKDEKLMKGLYTDLMHIPQLFEMRTSYWKRYFSYTPYTFDDRKVFYQSPKTGKYYSIMPNHWILAENSQHPNDLLNVIAKRYLVFNTERPIVGPSDRQIEGYLDWKKQELKVFLKKKNVNYKIKIQPIKKEDTLNFLLKKEQLQRQWSISVDEYKEFIVAVKDSLLRTFLYFNLEDNKDADRYLDNTDYYFDEGIYEYVEFYSPEKQKNRHIYNLNYKSKIKRHKKEFKHLISRFKKELVSKKIPYNYIDLDARKQIEIFAKPQDTASTYSSIKLDLYDLDTVKVELSKVEEFKEELLRELKYKEALAFYHWKYPINKATKTDNWQNYVFPSLKEFKQLQQGKTKNLEVSLAIKTYSYKVIFID